MKIATRNAKSELATDDVVTFPQGLPGFAEMKRYRLYHEHGDIRVFWLQSEEDPELQFSAVDPVDIRIQYRFSLTDEESALLQVENPENIAVLVLLYRDGAPDEASSEQIRANLLGPILINPDKRLGIQKVLGRVENYVTIHAD
jgi:flagellar assembly factor FliW